MSSAEAKKIDAFLDKDIIEFGFNLDVNQKIDFNQQKLILRNILKNRLNLDIVKLKKV